MVPDSNPPLVYSTTNMDFYELRIIIIPRKVLDLFSSKGGYK
jgi:hypothetical protein